MSMIKAIIFDCFGVLTYDGWLPFKKEHFKQSDEERQATDLGTQVNRGLLSYGDFIDQIAEMAHVPVDEVRQAIHNNVPNDELFAYIRTELKPNYKIGMLSNAGRDMLDEIFPAAHLALFDAIALSYETGHLKPDRRAFELIAERLGVEPEQCIFVDDQERYCTAAREMGMQAIVYTSFDEFQPQIQALLKSK